MQTSGREERQRKEVGGCNVKLEVYNSTLKVINIKVNMHYYKPQRQTCGKQCKAVTATQELWATQRRKTMAHQKQRRDPGQRATDRGREDKTVTCAHITEKLTKQLKPIILYISNVNTTALKKIFNVQCLYDLFMKKYCRFGPL